MKNSPLDTIFTPLAAAVRMDDHTLADMLLMFNADPEAKSRTTGEPTALGMAVMLGNVGMAKRLLDMGASAEAVILDLVPVVPGSFAKQFGHVPLTDYARGKGFSEMASLLEAALPADVFAHPPAPQPFTGADIAAAFRENCCAGTKNPLVTPKAARFTRHLNG